MLLLFCLIFVMSNWGVSCEYRTEFKFLLPFFLLLSFLLWAYYVCFKSYFTLTDVQICLVSYKKHFRTFLRSGFCKNQWHQTILEKKWTVLENSLSEMMNQSIAPCKHYLVYRKKKIGEKRQKCVVCLFVSATFLPLKRIGGLKSIH